MPFTSIISPVELSPDDPLGATKSRRRWPHKLSMSPSRLEAAYAPPSGLGVPPEPLKLPAPRLGQRSTGAAARHWPCSEEGSCRCRPSRSCSPPRPTSGENPLRPRSDLGYSMMRSRHRSAALTPLMEAPMELPPCACARAATGQSQTPHRPILPVWPRLDW
jgi:hypothetical protein